MTRHADDIFCAHLFLQVLIQTIYRNYFNAEFLGDFIFCESALRHSFRVENSFHTLLQDYSSVIDISDFSLMLKEIH